MIFRVILPTILFLIQIILYWRTVRWLKGMKTPRRWLRLAATALFLIFNVALLLAIIFRPRYLYWPRWELFTVLYPVYIWHGATFLLALILLCVELIKLPGRALLLAARKIPSSRRRLEQLRATGRFQTFDAGRRVFLRRGVAGLTTLSFSTYAYGMFVGTQQFQITEKQFRIPNLHPALSGFTIGLITDIHSGVFMTRSMMEEYVQAVNGLNTDLIAVVGDFVTSSVEEVYPFGEAFSQLHAPYGVIGVTGNHEFYTEDPAVVIREVEQCGIRLLRDEKTVISKNGGDFYLIGVDDPARVRGSLVRLSDAIGTTPLAIPKILLAHRPYFLANAAEQNVDLVLSGHTHGGQIVFGKVGNTILAPATIASPYVAGTYTMGTASMYVSRGVGTVGLPVRINCPPEVTRITLLGSESN